MIAALVDLELHLPAVGSLKGKRAVLKSLIAALRNDLNVSVAEVGYQDLWQRARLGVAVAAGSEIGARKVAQQVEKIVWREPRVEIVSFHVDVVASEE
ncbi:MAG TPA: DUF503 domain-containing protein [Egibacteraceae bacterium]|nr:DUF503 domain-containing protein [Egibacteraceae bacterium]